MAKDDPESSLAEDRALDAYVDDTPGGQRQRVLWPSIEAAFRAGFRAGQGHPRSGHRWGEGFEAGVKDTLAKRGAESQLGVELSKIRDRLNALETMHEGQPEKTTRWEKAIEGRLDELEREANTSTFVNIDNHIEGIWKRLDVLETHKRADVEMVNERLGRIEGLEVRLHSLEREGLARGIKLR